MEPSDFREFFIYNHKVRQEYICTFKRTLIGQDMTANHETAWLSLKDTLLHIIWADDTWINHSIQYIENPNRSFNYSKYQIWYSIEEYNSKITSKVDKYLSSIRQEDLDRKVYRANNDDIRRISRIKDVLIHVITEEIHHRGEMIGILWQMNIQPPDIDMFAEQKNFKAE
jgi:uncharacterized damage-inducible protein DinB